MASYEKELRAALEAVRGAARVCRAVQERLITRGEAVRAPMKTSLRTGAATTAVSMPAN